MAINNYSVIVCKNSQNDEWDAFVSLSSGVHYEQTCGWAVTNKMRGWHTWRIYIKSDGRVKAGSQVSFLEFPLVGRIGLVIQGPLVQDEEAGWLELFNLEMQNFLKKNDFLYVGIVIPYERVAFIDKMKLGGYVQRPKGLPPTAVVEHTLMLNLKRDKQELWSDISSGRRRNIKKGLKQDFVFREGRREELPVFHDLMLSMCDRRQTEPTHKNIEFFYSLWDNLEPQGWFKLFLLEYKSNVVCALVGFTVGDTFRYWKWGWSGEYPELNFSSVLIWKTIEWAKNSGFSFFDFVQVDYDVASAMKNSIKLSKDLMNRSFSGPTQFKMRFGGDIVSTPGVYVLFRNSVIKFIVLKIVVTLLNNKIVNRLIGIVRNRSIK